MPWIQRLLRGTKVFVKVRADGALAVETDGRVEIRYKLDDGAKAYRAFPANLTATGDPADVKPRAEAAPPPTAEVQVYTDGACAGNPGPMGIGVIVLVDGKRRELAEHLGEGTNNIAELVAVERALELLEDDRERTIAVHADSSYTIGVLARGFKARANQEIVARIRQRLARFPRLVFVKVEGHAGVAENERCDQLARAAATRGRA